MSDAAAPLLGLSRFAKRTIALAVDASLAVITVWLAFYLRLGVFVTFTNNQWLAVAGAVGLSCSVFWAMGLYRAIFRFVGSTELFAIVRAALVYGLFYATIFTAVGFINVPRTIGLIQPLLMLGAVVGSRVAASHLLGDRRKAVRRGLNSRVLIYGAGSAGRQLSIAIAGSTDMQAVGFVDDDEGLHGGRVNNLTIYDSKVLASLIEHLAVTDILLAIPSADRSRRNAILAGLKEIGVAVRTLPGLMDLAQGRVHTSDLLSLDIEDLLGRDTVPPDLKLIDPKIRDKTVLVTGAGGSIGSELCRQILHGGPTRLLILDLSEFALYAIHAELEQWQAIEGGGATEIVPLLGSVCDAAYVAQIMALWTPETVYHAAAYKHVPLVEHNMVVGVSNNVFGTLAVAEAAVRHGAADFVLISTDKAVRPTNVMGASKRLAEMVLQAMADDTAGTRFSMVRFGNVLGSSGSVVPLFRKQIADGGPVTITHSQMTRYFMTIPEAAQLVVQAGAMAAGGEVFVLDMGDPVRIEDLARNMIRLSGLSVRDTENPSGDIMIAEIGLRPGEKLFEELLIGNNPEPTAHGRIMKANEAFIPMDELRPRLAVLRTVLDGRDSLALHRQLRDLVPGYRPESGIVDWFAVQDAVSAEVREAAE